MKIKMLFILVICALSSSLIAQNINTEIRDPKLNKDVLVGFCNEIGLEKGEFGVYFKSQYEVYSPKAKTIQKIKAKINDYDIKIVFASWCSDSQLQLPRFYKILDLAEFKKSQLETIGVDRNKNAHIVDIADLNIELVPTFIIYKNGEEIGRIVETPRKTLESDLLKLIK